MTTALTTIESRMGVAHTLPAPLTGVLAPGACVHSRLTIVEIAEAYGVSLAAIQGIEVQGRPHPRLPVVVRHAAPGTKATPGLDPVRQLAPVEVAAPAPELEPVAPASADPLSVAPSPIPASEQPTAKRPSVPVPPAPIEPPTAPAPRSPSPPSSRSRGPKN